jgi:hypothetical protein
VVRVTPIQVISKPDNLLVVTRSEISGICTSGARGNPSRIGILSVQLKPIAKGVLEICGIVRVNLVLGDFGVEGPTSVWEGGREGDRR